ncbi:unnamed protein product [Blepharisma stoltei]|uniref:Xaa-Pro aminopeptidase n=1 Tax=Blepharisma stoltei TaxID=1481888 RepID=A0AAU9JUG2_9CILI|nr:unnamed protein product [Blepharisma stoltei]
MTEKLTQIRALMCSESIDAYFLPNNDFHNNENLCDHDKRLEFVSGFQGSNGQILITKEQALLWTDGRFWQKAEEDLDQGWTVMKMAIGYPTYIDWITRNLPTGSTIGYDPALICAESVLARTIYFNDKGFTFKPLSKNLVNSIWADQPNIPNEKLFIHDIKYAGVSAEQKIFIVLNQLRRLGSNYLFTSALDEIAWLLNLRGKDIQYNPLFFSFLLLHATNAGYQIILFINPEKTNGLDDYLSQNHIEVRPYESAWDYLSTIEENIIIDKNELSYSFYQKIKTPIHYPGLIAKIKVIKNPRELQGFRESHIRDGVAIAKYFAWLKQQLDSGADLNEWTSVEKLDEFRASEELNAGLSFENISSVGPNAAIIHYAPTQETAAKITNDQMYLLDSGGQYLDGTIDTTRTMHFGSPTDWEKECYTRVLLGNLGVERLVWPEYNRMSGNEVDVVARKWLWEAGLDYPHATGHGVGYFLNVHEGPHRICKGSTEPFQAGMNVANEPGYYEEGHFGIRIENILLVVMHPLVPGLLGFENVTMVPYDKNLLDFRLLSQRDIQYINAYHSKIWQNLSPILENRGETAALEWLRGATTSINQIIN